MWEEEEPCFSFGEAEPSLSSQAMEIMSRARKEQNHCFALDQGFKPLPLLLSKDGTADTLDCTKKILTVSVYTGTVSSG